MNTRDFDYELPDALIAQEPCKKRDGSRLLVLGRTTGQRSDRQFDELVELLPEGALLVLNDTRVFPARLRGKKPTAGAVEVLLVSPCDGADEPGSDPTWHCLCRSSKGLSEGGTVHFADQGGFAVTATVRRTLAGGAAELAFRSTTCPKGAEKSWFWAWIALAGETPLPPYIRRPAGELDRDRERYQTIYARHRGSVAAPTAGLHFTEPLLTALRSRDVELAYATLHVGPGTFRPVRTEQLSEHQMDAERVEITPALAEAVSRAKSDGRPVVAVGTTTVRALEGMAAANGELEVGRRAVSLFIAPGHVFRIVEGLITNFHLPRSTLLMLVSAFADRERVLAAYKHAVATGYRFYSYGDAMLIQ